MYFFNVAQLIHYSWFVLSFLYSIGFISLDDQLTRSIDADQLM